MIIISYQLPSQKILSHHLKFVFSPKSHKLKHSIKKVSELGYSKVNKTDLYTKILSIIQHTYTNLDKYEMKALSYNLTKSILKCKGIKENYILKAS